MTIDHTNWIADFLLGKLSDERSAEIEKQFFADDALFDELRIAENELTDAYVAGSLTSDDRSRFEQRLMISPSQRSRVVFAETLLERASRNAECRIAGTSEKPAGILASLSALFSIRPLAFGLAAASVLVVLTAVFLLINRPVNAPESEMARTDATFPEAPANHLSESEPAAAPEPGNAAPSNLATAPKPPVASTKPALVRPATFISTIILAAGGIRGNTGAKSFSLPARATHVRLSLPADDTSYSKYVAVVETVEGRQIASVRATRQGNNIGILLPASQLKSGDYIVTLKAAAKSGVVETVGEYSFSIK